MKNRRLHVAGEPMKTWDKHEGTGWDWVRLFAAVGLIIMATLISIVLVGGGWLCQTRGP